MWTTKIPVFFAILCCFVLPHINVASAGKVTAHLKHFQLPTNKYALSDFFENGLGNETFVYMSCSNTDSSIVVSTCRVTLDSATGESKFCDVKMTNDNLELDKNMKFLSPNKAIVAWDLAKTTDDPYGALMLSVVHFDDGCKVYEAKIPNNKHTGPTSIPVGLQVLRYDDSSFDVIYEDEEKCGKQVCKIGFDDKAKKVRDMKPWIKARNETEMFQSGEIRVSALVPGSPKKGSLIFDSNESTILMWRMDVDGEGVQKLLRNYTDDNDDVDSMDLVHSSAHNLLTLCWHVERVPTKCEQMDFYGKSVVQSIDIPFSEDYNPKSLSVHSLSGGGFLVGGVVGCNIDRCSLDSKKYGITKYGKDGKKVGMVVVDGLECDLKKCMFPVSLFEKSDGKYCLRQICMDEFDRKTPIGKSNLSLTCFSDKDFS